MAHEQDRQELFLRDSQITKGFYQRPVPPIYTRVIMEGTKATLKTVGSQEVSLPRDEDLYVDLAVLRQRTARPTAKRDLKNTDDWIVHEPSDLAHATYKPIPPSLDTRFVKYPKTISFHRMPAELSRFEKDEYGQDLGRLTLGKALRESGINHIQTDNHGIIRHYATSKILYITESYLEGYYAIVYLNEADQLVRDTRQLF